MDMNVNLPVDVRAPAQARHVLDDLHGHVPSEILERSRLAVSELVTNALQHAGLSADDHIRLIVRVADRRLRVEVKNPGAAFSADVQRPGPTSERGRGLLLVQESADRWGVIPHNGVGQWFEIDIPA